MASASRSFMPTPYGNQFAPIIKMLVSRSGGGWVAGVVQACRKAYARSSLESLELAICAVNGDAVDAISPTCQSIMKVPGCHWFV